MVECPVCKGMGFRSLLGYLAPCLSCRSTGKVAKERLDELRPIAEREQKRIAKDMGLVLTCGAFLLILPVVGGLALLVQVLFQ